MIQLGDYRAEFMKQAVAGPELWDLSEEDLKSLGVTKIGHKKRLLKKIRQLQRGLECALTIGNGDDDTTSTASSKYVIFTS